MPFKFRSRASLMAVLFLTTLQPAQPQESNNNFCGTSWDDASENCKERQHCPSGTDDECTTEGHICFGATMCDVNDGGGSLFAFMNVPYDDISNTRFCGTGWTEAAESCSIESHCPTGFNDDCPDGMSCYGGLSCNVKDLMEELEASNAANATAAEAAANKIDKDDPRRNQFCGISWGDASSKCSEWCPDADDSKCPGGQTCFGDTSCYYSDDLVPTLTPTYPQTAPPTTRAPAAYKDPANNRFCGVSWGAAVAACSIETSCPSGSDDDCPKGETCHGGLSCNLIDLLEKNATADGPTLKPTMPPRDEVSNSQFCGDSWDNADQSCSLATHCPDGNCPEGQVCYGGTSCNAADMTKAPSVSPTVSPTLGPTNRPTGPTQSPTNGPPTTEAPIIPPTLSPTITPKPTEQPVIFIPEDDIRHSFWCGKDWNDVITNCPQPCTTGEDTECPKGQICFAFTTCRPSPKPSKPTTPSPPSDTNSTESSIPTADNSTDTQTEIDSLDEESSSPIASPTENATETVDAGNEDNSTMTASTIFNIDTDAKIDIEDTNSSAATEIPLVTKQTRSPFASQKTRTPVASPLDNQTTTESPSTILSPPLIWNEIETDPPSSSSTTLLWLETDDEATPSPSATLVWTESDTEAPSVQFDYLTSETTSPSPPPSTQYLNEETLTPTPAPADEAMVSSVVVPKPNPELLAKAGSILRASSNRITNEVLLYLDAQTGAELPSTMYNYDGFLEALNVYSKGLMGSSHFYFGDDTISSINYGLVSIALFLAHASIETVKFDICDEISWEKDVFGHYPIANACGQGGFSGVSSALYADTNPCKEEEAHMACKVDSSMKSTAATMGAWAGAPPPLECFPKTTANLVTGAWNPLLTCEEAGCDYYQGHSRGDIDPNSIPAKNSFGRTDTEGCCWWGRGAFPRGSSGTCKVGKLNHFLGKFSSQARYDVDFCSDPEALCRGSFDDDVKNAELRWLIGLQYWIDDVQSYSKGAFSYLEQVHAFVDGGLSDDTIFDAISTIVTRGECPSFAGLIGQVEWQSSVQSHIMYGPGCHDCGKPISNDERRAKFDQIVSIFGSAQAGETFTTSPTTALLPTLLPTLRPTLRLNPVSGAPVINTKTPISDVAVIRTQKPASNAPTSAPMASAVLTTTSSTINVADTLSADELADRLQFAHSYCASSLRDAQDNCSTTLKTCNADDPPCDVGTACFSHVICTIQGAAGENDLSLAEDSSAANLVSSSPSPSPLSPQTLDTVLCGQACLRPMNNEECAGAGSAISVFPDCLGIQVGEVCKSQGECGPSLLVRNCQGQSVFLRVTPDQCSPTTDNDSMDVTPQSPQPSTILTYTSDPTSSPKPSAATATLDEILASQAGQAQNNNPGYGDIGATWWRDVPLESSSCMTSTILPMLLTMTLLVIIT